MERKLKEIETLAQSIFAYDLDRPSIPVADALAKKLYELGYRKVEGEPLSRVSDNPQIKDSLLAELSHLYNLIEAEIQSYEYDEEPRKMIETLDDAFYSFKQVIETIPAGGYRRDG